MSTIDQWTAAVCADLGLDPDSADLRTVLDLTRDVAHGVARPAAPLTAYLVGLAVGRGLPLPDAAGRVLALAAGWHQAAGEETGNLPNGPGSRPGASVYPAGARGSSPRDQQSPAGCHASGYRTLTDLLIALRPAAGLP